MKGGELAKRAEKREEAQKQLEKATEAGGLPVKQDLILLFHYQSTNMRFQKIIFTIKNINWFNSIFE